MKLEEKIKDLSQQFGLKPEDLNLDLGSLGNSWSEFASRQLYVQ